MQNTKNNQHQQHQANYNQRKANYKKALQLTIQHVILSANIRTSSKIFIDLADQYTINDLLELEQSTN